ncbi:MAG: SAM-dependent methyltransferase [Verrucomicrobia bacterium]|nr:SAM-dependent methyltransferase [Verrucomicrobiota bacterium]
MPGQLLLLPNLLNKEAEHQLYFPISVDRAVQSITGLIAENEKEGRAYLKRFGVTVQGFPIKLLNEHSQDIEELLAPMKNGERWGLISDAGLPVLADPGYLLVRRARMLGIAIEAFIGPSSLILALMLSGLPAQRFSFHGYFPYEPEKALKKLEERSREEKATQVFIETPYRNEKMLATLLATLSDSTVLSVAWDLTMPTQGVETYPVKDWKRRPLPNIHKHPAVFLFLSQ